MAGLGMFFFWAAQLQRVIAWAWDAMHQQDVQIALVVTLWVTMLAMFVRWLLRPLGHHGGVARRASRSEPTRGLAPGRGDVAGGASV